MADADWERRFVTDPVRAREAADLYTRAGFEVRVEPAVPDGMREECEDCALMQARLFRVIYTRRLPTGPKRGSA